MQQLRVSSGVYHAINAAYYNSERGAVAKRNFVYFTFQRLLKDKDVMLLLPLRIERDLIAKCNYTYVYLALHLLLASFYVILKNSSLLPEPDAVDCAGGFKCNCTFVLGEKLHLRCLMSLVGITMI